MTFENNSHAYIVENGRNVREVVIVRRSGDFYLVRFADRGGGIRLREGRIFATQEAAEETLPKAKKVYRSPYDYWH